MNMSDFNKRQYDRVWKAFNDEMKRENSLRDALLCLESQQLDAGFIRDDLHSVVHFRLHHPQDKSRIFQIQYNPRRAVRLAGAGRKVPPAGSRSTHNGCFLCKDNIRWQQQGVEIGLDIETNRGDYIAWMNPFPLKSVHATIAARDHIKQSWITEDESASIARFEAILADLLDLASRLPGFVGFYNGVGAGASLPDHFHFHFFMRAQGSGPFPLERATLRMNGNRGDFASGTIVRDYPITAIYFLGQEEELLERSTQWIRRLLIGAPRYLSALTANLIAFVDADARDRLHLFIVPRNKFFAHAPGMAGMIGGLEVLGEIVFSTELEKQLLDTGQVDYFFVERILSAVEPLGITSELR